ncbi:MAG TPA: O-antigen ligase family protein [Vicinamibacterales bacterium]|nr:O-antigen ligase family protein [Vicinamibacterales bacterium]
MRAETLTFNYGPGDTLTRPRPPEEETFATTVVAAEPRDWGYVGLLAFTTVLLLRPQDLAPSLTPLHLAEVCAFLGIGPMLLHRFARRLPVFRMTPETIGLVVLGAAIIGTAPFSVWPGGAIEVFTDNYIKIVIVFVLMMNTLTTVERLERLTWLILCCTGIIAALGVLNYAAGTNLVENGRLAGPVSGIFGNPNDLAMNMVTFLPPTAVVAMSKRQSPMRRTIACLIAFFMLATIVFTKSRGGLLGLGAAVGALAMMGRSVRRGFGTTLVAMILVATPFAPMSFWTRMASIVDAEQDKQEFTGSREARRLVMTDGINAFLEYPITGVGAGQFKNYNPSDRQAKFLETHNVLIQVAAETGIIGLLAFAFLIWRAIKAALETQRLTRDRRWMSSMRARHREDVGRALVEHTVGLHAGLIGWFVCAMFASLAYNWTFYYVLALIVAARALAIQQVYVAAPVKQKSVSVS